MDSLAEERGIPVAARYRHIAGAAGSGPGNAAFRRHRRRRAAEALTEHSRIRPSLDERAEAGDSR